MESIIRHCSVMSPKEFANAGNEGDDVFLCEYEYDIQWHNFKRIAEIDDNEDVCWGWIPSKWILYHLRIHTFLFYLQDGERVDDDEDWNSGDEFDSDSEEAAVYEDEKKKRLSQASSLHRVAAVCYFPLCCHTNLHVCLLHNQPLDLDSFCRTRARDTFLGCKRLGQRKYQNI